MHKLEFYGYGTKNDRLSTLLMENQLEFEFIFKNLCAIKSKLAIIKKVVGFDVDEQAPGRRAGTPAGCPHSQPNDDCKANLSCKGPQIRVVQNQIKNEIPTDNYLVIPIVCVINSAAANTFYTKCFTILAFFKSI